MSVPPDALSLPTLIFDSHLHIIDPRFTLVANWGFVPDAFTVGDYQRALANLAWIRGPWPAGPLSRAPFRGSTRVI